MSRIKIKTMYGIDPALTHTGVAKMNGLKLMSYLWIKPPDDISRNKYAREVYTVHRILDFIPYGSTVVIEDYAFSTMKHANNKDSEFKEMVGLLIHRLLERNCSFWKISPRATRIWAVDGRKVDRTYIKSFVYKRFEELSGESLLLKTN